MRLSTGSTRTWRGPAALAAAGLCALAGLLAPQAQASPAAASPSTWRVAKVFAGQPYSNLIPMTAISAGSAWLFGDGASNREVALHFNGSTWTPSYPFGTLPRPWFVSATGASNIWVTGQNCTSSGVDYVAMYNGRSWRTWHFKLTTSSEGGPFCQAPVVTTGPANGWIFSNGGVPGGNVTKALHFNGTKWSGVTLGSFGDVVEASAVSATDIYLLTYTLANKMLVVHYDGRTWKAVPLPAAPAPKGAHPYPAGITTPSGKSVWIATVLVHTNPDGSGNEINASRLLHFDGSKWSWVTVPGTDDVTTISYDAGGVWMPGQRADSSGTGWDFLHWNGTTWATVPVPSAGIPGTGVSYQIYSLVHIPGTHSFWASGDADYSTPANTQGASAVVFKYGP